MVLFIFYGESMKKVKSLLFFSGLFFLLCVPLSVCADSDGSLQLNSNLITNQSGENSGASDFEIRAQLFSKDLEQKTEDKAKQEAEITKVIDTIDFNQDSQNELYKMSYRSVKMKLFKDYRQADIISNDLNSQSSTKGVIIILILTMPLLVLTGFIARMFARRKRRKG